MSRLTELYGRKAADRQEVQAEYRRATQRKLQHFGTQQERIDAFRQRAAAQSGIRRQAVSGLTEQYRGTSGVVQHHAARRAAPVHGQQGQSASPIVQKYAGRAPKQQQQLQQHRQQEQGLGQ